jgi:hypothetical protein
MPRRSSAQKPLIFRGPPNRLRLLGALPDADHWELKPEQSLQDYFRNRGGTFHFTRNRRGDFRSRRPRFSRYTPPGTYSCEMKSASKKIPVEIQVEPKARVRIQPSQIGFSGAPGAKVRAELLFSNKGNVSFTIPKSDSLGIFDDDGLETAFASTYRLKESKLDALLGNFIEKLRDSHGGLLKFRIVEGDGELPPGEVRSVVIEAQIPSTIKPGHGYHGVWSTSLFDYSVTVTVTKK